jgi:hypothetical protein
VTTEQVVTTWLATLPGITTAMVGRQLPQPDPAGNLSWAASGYLTPYGLGGTPNIYAPVAAPVIGIKCWAVDPNTGQPPWGLAANLAETIRAGCFSNCQPQYLTVPYADRQATLMSVYMLTEPRTAFGDLGDYACYDCELQFFWHAR